MQDFFYNLLLQIFVLAALAALYLTLVTGQSSSQSLPQEKRQTEKRKKKDKKTKEKKKKKGTKEKKTIKKKDNKDRTTKKNKKAKTGQFCTLAMF